ncbi:hypothetical protein MAPG_05320 [Magnaporthiopsis poae ATCC 64411]|uniref:Peptidase A1 domain-containing protein n=1 Tax=Magnaporthiopsis poae (strain ATCC 64411 / 73-15) TaxID=644358 RepID=A0A0C4DZ32_MAGP6|nr:hypothetical protein MAPG_05320 [Magnaporthiopsis poae ATCC 64411]
MLLLSWVMLIWHVRAQSRVLAVYSSSGGVYGPFGPWAAPEILLGTTGVRVPFYPRTSGFFGSLFYSGYAGGSYLPSHSTTAKPNGTDSVTSSWSPIDNTRGEARVYYDIITLGRDDDSVAVNISMIVIDKIVYYGKYQGVQGSHGSMNWIGFGYRPRGYWEDDLSHVDDGYEFIHELKANQSIGSKSFGFHLGIAGFARYNAASLTLGGYERNRVLGQPAVFDWPASRVFVVDILVGVQLGDSPFPLITGPTSIFRVQGHGEEDEQATRAGGKAGSVLVSISAEVPHIGLPYRTCNSLAQHLPVTWDSSLNLYVWNTAEPAFERITQSAAYLAIVLSDRMAREVTIKIPFKALALVFDPPSPGQKRRTYLPCDPKQPGGYYLGRAFLQAAFWGIDYEQKAMYIAQAPGPSLGQSVLLPFPTDGGAFDANDDATFEQTWAGHWTPFNKSATTGLRGLSKESIVFIAVGCACAILLAIALRIAIHRRRRKNTGRGGDIIGEPNPENSPLMAVAASYSDLEVMLEMDPQVRSHEISHPLAHELSADPAPCELPTRSWTPISRRRSI